jgi:hypothetical protein
MIIFSYYQCCCINVNKYHHKNVIAILQIPIYRYLDIHTYKSIEWNIWRQLSPKFLVFLRKSSHVHVLHMPAMLMKIKRLSEHIIK